MAIRWLITGGAGFIGGHVTRAFARRGADVAVYDDLSTGVAARLESNVPLFVGSVQDRRALASAISDFRADGIVHLAANKSLTELTDSKANYRQNVDGLRCLIDAMNRTTARRLVFASSAAVYGVPDVAGPLGESQRVAPINTYGLSKAACERMLLERGRNSSVRWISLRYFNVAGAGRPDLCDSNSSSVVPAILNAASRGREFTIMGVDYSTPDGSAVRDYVHVVDVAEATVAAAGRVDEYNESVYNVGTGLGLSVLELAKRLDVALRLNLRLSVGPRRAGDPPHVVADISRIRADLGWYPRLGISAIVRSSGWFMSSPQQLSVGDFFA